MSHLLRHAVLRLLRRFNPGPITIRHHWTGDRVRLDCFVHRTYWYHGRSREKHLMEWFAKVLRPGDQVVELGGHIGYLSLYLAHLVGRTGRVIVYEPAPDNLAYIRNNLAGRGNVELRERAIGNLTGTFPMFLESLSGMNNSFVPEFELLANNAHYSGIPPNVRVVKIPVVRLDDDLILEKPVALVKMDIEGFELEALRGMDRILTESKPILAVEVNARHNSEVDILLRGSGYDCFAEDGHPIQSLPHDLIANTLWLDPDTHRDAVADTKRWS